MILVTGAAGKTGRTIIQALAGRGAKVRAYVHRDTHVAAVRAAGAAEVLVGDLQDAAMVRQAMQGVQALYHICPNMHPDEIAIGREMITAARAADVEQFVYHSVLHPQTETMPHHWHKLRVEELLFAARLPFTILQPAAYMQNILASWQNIHKHGLYTIPYRAATQLSLVDLADVGTVAATVLTEPGHHGATYELVGTTGLTQTDVAATLSAVLRRPVQVEEHSRAVWTNEARTGGLRAYAIDTLLKMFVYYEQHGLVGNPNTLSWLLGRAPTSLATFIQRVAHTSP